MQYEDLGTKWHHATRVGLRDLSCVNNNTGQCSKGGLNITLEESVLNLQYVDSSFSFEAKYCRFHKRPFKHVHGLPCFLATVTRFCKCFFIRIQYSTHYSDKPATLRTPTKYYVGPEKTTPICSISYRDMSSRSFKSCKLQGGAYTDQSCFSSTSQVCSVRAYCCRIL